MSKFAVLAWPPLLRPPLPYEELKIDPGALSVPLKALACRNQLTSVIALVTADEPQTSARLIFSDLTCEADKIESAAIRVRVAGVVPTPEAGPVCDPLFELDEFPIDKTAALHANIAVPRGIRAGIYHGSVSLIVNDARVATNSVEVEVADVDIPDMQHSSFFLNVWANPAPVARRAGVEVWSDEHFELMRPYIQDLAAHGQKTVVAPICYQPWGTQTLDPYPNLILWKKRKDEYEFDFSSFDRYVRLHEQCGIDSAIHCYSIVQGPGDTDRSVISYMDVDKGVVQFTAKVGSPRYVKAWGAFFEAFRAHLTQNGWLDRTYIAFDEKPIGVMNKLMAFIDEHAYDFNIALAANSRHESFRQLDDLSLLIPFDGRGVAETAPPERAAQGLAQFLSSPGAGSLAQEMAEKTITTFYVCCFPPFPNTFLFSPLVESRMLPFLALQGGFDGFLRWAYNDWSADPFTHPEWANWASGDVFFVYPSDKGPITSLRWEQLREGICDYELAAIASANIRTPDEIVDYEQAITLACRNPNGNEKSIGDIEIARRLLIPIARHARE